MKKIAFLGVLVFLVVLSLGFTGSREKKCEFRKAPPLPSEGIWLNTQSSDKKIAFDRQLTLLYFWDYTSIHCLRELAYLKKWHKLYTPYGFKIVFIHAPEYQFAKNRENLTAALDRLGVTYPVYMDNDFKVWEAYGVISWPTKYLVDTKARIIHSQIGEGHYAVMERKIRKGLLEMNPNAVLPKTSVKMDREDYDAETCGYMSAETSLGYKNDGWLSGELANQLDVFPEQTCFYRDRGDRVEHGYFVHGKWTNRIDQLEHARDVGKYTDYLGVLYSAHEVYAVISHEQTDDLKSVRGGNDIKIYVTRDEVPVPRSLRGPDLQVDESGETFLRFDQPRLYYLVTREDDRYHELKLWPQKKGVGINSFSFSNRCLSEFEHV
ncbi:MAG: redoxin domain-containing protein [Candidatus Omnitrophica bacterium]|nr:redoxin domain-containing protein [Candidatus Omnitrophota bacterium]